MQLTPAQIAASPDHYLHSFEGADGVIVPMNQAAYARSIFLDARISPAGEGAVLVPAAQLAAAAPPLRPAAWIFHVAHCGSTLLARAFEALSTGLVLREPMALRQLAFAPDQVRLRLVLAMLSRRYEGEELTLIKANVPVNALLPAIAAADPAAPGVFLYLGLEDYALAVLRSPQHRGWVREMAARFAGAPRSASDTACLAALWLWQLRAFVAALDVMPQTCTLDAERFYAEPAACLAALARLFGRQTDPARLAELVQGPLFTTYSKRPGAAFTNAARLQRRAALLQDMAGELADVRRLAQQTAADLAALEARMAAAMIGF